jgi:L,D-transpeptidase ErfK/SrfK
MRVLCVLLLSLLSLHARAVEFRLPPPGEDIVGDVFTIRIQRYEDTLNQYAEAYGVGFRELMSANPGINPWVPGEGREVLIPAQYILPAGDRVGVVINLAEQRLFWYHPERNAVITYPMGIGREGWQTPLITTKVTKIIKNPNWYPPASIRAEHAAMGDPLPTVVGPGPDNPLGAWKVQLAVPSILIHGSNRELGVGMRVSHGCMRLYTNDIEEFATHVPPGTPVRIINSPVKVGWKGGAMFVEVHEALEEQRTAYVPEAAVADAIHIANRVSARPVDIDWLQAKAAAVRRSGLPVRVSSEQVAAR